MILLIPTCKDYADVLPFFVYFLNKNWPVSKYRRIFINSPLEFEGFENYKLDRDYGWSGNVLGYINGCKIKENLLLVHDDYLLLNPVNDEKISKVDADVQRNIGSIRLIRYSDNRHGEGFGWKWASRQLYSESYHYADRELFFCLKWNSSRGYLDKSLLYSRLLLWKVIRSIGIFRFNRMLPDFILSRVWGYLNTDSKGWWSTRLPISHQPAIWNVEYLKRHLNSSWSPWQHEVLGSRELLQRGTINGKKCEFEFLTLKEDYWMYCNAIRDGKFSSEFVRLISDAKLPCPNTRDIAREYDALPQAYKAEIDGRQTNGSYPKQKF